MIFSGFKGAKKIPFTQKVYDKILSVDGFGFPVQLLLKKSDQQQTFFGGFLTVGLMTLCLVYFYQMMEQMITRSDPTVLTNTLFNQVPHRVDLNINEFFFAFAIQNEDTFAEYKNTSLFDVQFKQCTKNESNFECQQLPIEPCNFNKHVQIESIQDFFKDKPMQDYYCLNSDFWTQTPPHIQGTFDNNYYAWIAIEVSRCRNQTQSNIICASDQEIDLKLNGGYYEIFFSDSIANFLNPESPYSKIARTVYDAFSIQSTKEYDMYFRQLLTDSDYGYVMESMETQETFAYSTYQTLNMNKKSDTFLNVILRLETKLDQTKRSYYKIQDIFGIIGGFWQSIAIVGILIITPINKLQYQITLLNSLFTFELDNDDSSQDLHRDIPQAPYSSPFNQRADQAPSSRTNTLRDVSKQQKSKSTAYQVFRDYIDQRVGNKKGKRRRTVGEDFKNLIKQNVGKLKLNTWEVLGYFTNCLEQYRAKQNQINFALKKLEKDIDLIHILKKLIEVEKLKMLLLSEDQLKLFDYLPRPCIPLEVEPGEIEQKYLDILNATADKKMQFWQMLHNRKTLKQRAFEAYESYDKILRQGKKSDIDQKLIQFLDPNIRQLFEIYYESNQKSSCNINISKVTEIKHEDKLDQSSMAEQINEKEIDEQSNFQERDKYLAMQSQRSKIFDGNM